MTVNGKRMDLETFLLDVVERPLPNEPTHYVVADVLNTDLSVKRVTVYFNPQDTWKGNYNYGEHTPESVGLAIGDSLSFLNADPNTLAYKFHVVEVATNKVVLNPRSIYTLTKCEL